MCYWIFEKRSGAADKSTKSGLMARGKAEESEVVDKAAATAHSHSAEKAVSASEGRLQGTIEKEREEEVVS